MQPQSIILTRRSKDLTGQRFGKLVAIEPVARNKHGHLIWFCQCDCGSTTTTLATYLGKGTTKSCGCARWDGHSRRTHGMTGTPLYDIWCGIITRCTNSRRQNYGRYGGRGIFICNEWRHDFMAFHDYVSVLPHCGEAGYTLDRINNNGDYEPANVRWASIETQNSNTRQNRLLTFQGRTQTVTAWARELQMPDSTLFTRLRKGWSIEKALTTPVKHPHAP